ncbi:MAG: hypothetical protein EOO88_53210 [Pedobacter sp.]|nr:MAG: hypothetical protein EOO88_53210 [Pedobacter sp.]
MKKTNEKQVEDKLKAWSKAIRDGDLEAVMQMHTNDVIMFDVLPPFQITGKKALKKNWDIFFEHSKGGNGSFNLSKVKIKAANELSLATAALKVGSIKVRLTVGLVKENGEWMICHEHHSVLER